MKAFIFVALFLAVAFASDVSVDNDDYNASLDADEFVDLGAKTSASLFESAKHGVTATAEAMAEAKATLTASMNKMMVRHPAMAASIGIINYAKLSSKGPDGYGEMDNIMTAVDELAKKIEGEAKEALTTITAVRAKCVRDKATYRKTIADADAAITLHTNNINAANLTITTSTNDITASKARVVTYEGNIGSARRTYKETADGYWERRFKRDKERRTLKLALFLTCDFRAFQNHEYCVYLKSRPDDQTTQGCDIEIKTACKAEPNQVLKFEDEVGYLTKQSNANIQNCAKRAIDFYTFCGNTVDMPVIAKFRTFPVAFEYPTQDLDNWLKAQEEKSKRDDEEYNLKMQGKIAEEAVAMQKKLKAMDEEDLQRRKMMAEAGLTSAPPTPAPKTVLLDVSSKLGVKVPAGANPEIVTELVEEATWSKEKIFERRQQNVRKMDVLMARSRDSDYVRILSQAQSLMAEGSLDSLDSEATEDIKAARKTLVDLLKNLRGRMKDEQDLEDADFKTFSKEIDVKIKSNQASIATEVTLQQNLENTILVAKNQITVSTNIITSSRATKATTAEALRKTTISCKEAEDEYIVSKFQTDEELINVDKLRSVLRVLATSDLPKCPNDCTNREQGYCQWKGRFGADSVCACEPEWYGIDCNRRRCPGTGSNPVTSYAESGYGSLYEKDQVGACTSRTRGTCDNDGNSNTKGQCICNTDYYHGPKKACEYKRCPGNNDYDPIRDPTQSRACNRRGVCDVQTGTCTCTPGGKYYGSACELLKCYNTVTRTYQTADDATVCGGRMRGTCDNTTGRCVCSSSAGANYYGDNCENKRCVPACQNGGTCTTNGVCQCVSGYEGSSCERKSCPGGCNDGVSSYNRCNFSTGRCECVGRVGSNVYSGPNCAKSDREFNYRVNEYSGERSFNSRTYANWWGTYDNPGISSCNSAEANSLMVGMWYNNCSRLYCIESATCIRPKHNGVLGTTVCRDINITWGSGESYQACDANEFMGGIGRSSRMGSGDDMTYMNQFRCCKIQFDGRTMRRNDSTCYDTTFNGYGWWAGDSGSTHFMIGLHKQRGLDLGHINKGRFCTFEF